MSEQLFYSPQAQLDLEEIYDYFADETFLRCLVFPIPNPHFAKSGLGVLRRGMGCDIIVVG